MNYEINWVVREFEDLTTSQLYAILHLRSKIFVVEQSDVYLDPDYLDQKAIHILGYVDAKVVAYCRVFKTGTFFHDSGCIGRVVVAQEYRSHGFGRNIINKAFEILSSEKRVQIAAQLYLQEFYEGFGFVAIGRSYMDGSIEHIDMCYVSEKLRRY